MGRRSAHASKRPPSLGSSSLTGYSFFNPALDDFPDSRYYFVIWVIDSVGFNDRSDRHLRDLR
jgi:hypothetical protein